MNTDYQKCQACGENLDWWTRSDKKYCDATCRKRYHRAKVEAERISLKIGQLVNALERTLERKPHARTPQALEAIQKLQARLSDLIDGYDYL